MGPVQTSRGHQHSLLQSISCYAKYRKINAEEFVFRRGDFVDQWFILLSGSVIIDTEIYFENSCFGLRSQSSHFRVSDCIALEESQVMIIDYPREPSIAPNSLVPKPGSDHRYSLSSTSTEEKPIHCLVAPETHSSSSSSLDINQLKKDQDSEPLEMDLPEEGIKDTVLDILRRETRSTEDVQFLFDQLHNLPALASLTQATALRTTQCAELEGSKPALIYEQLEPDSEESKIVTQGTPAKLLEFLIEDHTTADPTYVEDFLLTQRIFIDSPHAIAARILNWLKSLPLDVDKSVELCAVH
ncbi:hypothetical protein Ciccas_004258 [Cichlidogyrus casuarinus]|uniref:N-terminal Ras-GEF domain-containing protein n=1 Tax=Cichlidogyrus casuarinus TaxID=1844966 RepID=A0ABD2QCW9_9PLAT